MSSPRKRKKQKRAKRNSPVRDNVALGKTFVVKIQLERFPNPGASCLIYNESRSVYYEETITPAMKKLMAGREKAYFKAHLENHVLHIDGDSDEQDW